MNPLTLILEAAVVTATRGVVSIAAVEPVATSRAASASTMSASSEVTDAVSVNFSSAVQVTSDSTMSSATSDRPESSGVSTRSASTRAMNSVQLVAAALLCLLLVAAAASTAVLGPSRAAMLLATVSASATRSASVLEQATRTGMASVWALLQVLTAVLHSLKAAVTLASLGLMTQPFRPSSSSAKASLSQHSQAATAS